MENNNCDAVNIFELADSFSAINPRFSIKKIKQLMKVSRKMKYEDNYCPNCGSVVDSDFCSICGRKHE